MKGIWKTLGIERTRERNDVRRAYAAQLKKTNPEDDPEGFKRLREAYDAALSYVDNGYEPYNFQVVGGDWQVGNDEDHDDDDYDADDEADDAEESAPDVYEADAATLDRNALRDVRRRLRAEDGSDSEADAAGTEEPPPETFDREALRDQRRRARARQASDTPDPEAAAVQRDFEGACARLARLVAQADSDPDLLRETAVEVLGSEALIDVGVYNRTEGWLSELIAYNFPRSDAVIELAIERFDWRAQKRALRVSHAIQMVLSREEDLFQLRRLRARSHPDNPAFRALTGAGSTNALLRRTKAPWIARKVRKLLEKIEHEHPTLRNDLDESAVDWWRQYFGKPSIGPTTWLVLLIAPLVVGLFGFMAGAPAPRHLINGATAWAVSAAALLALVLVRHFAFAVPRHRWRYGWAWRAPLWLKAGWGGLGLAAMAIAALLPTHPAATALVSALSMGVLVWSFTVAEEVDATEDLAARIGRALWSNAMLVVFWFVMVWSQPGAKILQLSIPLLVTAIAFAREPLALFEAWRRVERPVRFAAFGGLTAVAAGAAVLGLSAPADSWGAGVAAMLVAAVSLLQRVPAMLQGPTALKVRYYVGLATVIGGLQVLRHLADVANLPFTIIGMGVLLIGAAISLACSLLVELQSRDR